MFQKLSIVPFLFSIFFLYKGYDKMTNYHNPGESSIFRGDAINAYVGGDAYNYIINGNYAVAFLVVALFFLVLGLSFIFLHEIRLKQKLPKYQPYKLMDYQSGEDKEA